IVDATVVNVPVRPGEAVRAGDTLIEVETDKASMPIPAPGDGTVAELKVKRGDKIKVGTVIATIGDKAAAAPPAPAAKPQAATKTPAPSADGARREFTLPNLGEGIESGTIVAVQVKPGDTVTAGQELFTIETDKASMPLTADANSRVDEVRVKQGDKVNVGAVLAVLSGGKGERAAAPAPA